jgi:outer membrane protein, heavy metal efflux system
MERRYWRFCLGLLFAVPELVAQSASPGHALSWQETQAKFKANNPALLAGQVTIDESRADEITAYLRPNPNLNFSLDQFTPYSSTHGFRPIWQLYPSGSIDYLHERQHKRELRLQSAQKDTALAISSQADLQRNLMFNLRDAFVRVLLAKSVVELAKNNLSYYDNEIEINQERYKAGAIAKVDLQRVELQRIQFESDLQTSTVGLRTAKIDLLALMRDTTPVDQFDINEPFDFNEPISKLEDLRDIALQTRPDLKAAEQALEKARTDHQLAIANGSTDPTFSVNGSRQAEPLNTYFGVGVSIPLRIFDRNQGDKLHTLLDINRNAKLRDSVEVTALHDVDSAYATLQSTVALLKPYQAKYLKEAQDIREEVSYAYQHGGASLIEFLDAQKQFRDTQLNYLNLVGAYYSAANQVNFSVGREVIQ